MESVSGVLKVGEADATRRDIAKRFYTSSGGEYHILIALVIAGAAIGGVAWRGAGMAIGVACAFLLYWTIPNRLSLKRYRRRLVERGMASEFPMQMTLDPEALSYEIGDVRHIAKWSAVTEVFPSQGYWVFLVHQAAWAVPKRFFADEVSERAFIGAALASMREEARGRSGAAKHFAAIS